MNQPPDYCPYCGSPLTPVDSNYAAEHADIPMIYYCSDCDDHAFYNPTPGGSTVVVDDDSLLLVEDFRSPGEWKLPAGRMELGESPRAGVARELDEETGLTADPDDLVYLSDAAAEPVPGQYMISITYAIHRDDTTGPLHAASDATDARFFTPYEFHASDHELKFTHVHRHGDDSLLRLLQQAKIALEHSPMVHR